jgi:hypothetical protein
MRAGYLEAMRRQAGRDISDEEIRQVWVDQWNRAHPAPPGAPEPAPPWMAPAGVAYWPYYQAAAWGMGGMGIPAAPAMPSVPPAFARPPTAARVPAARMPARRPWVLLEPDTVYTVPLSVLRCLPDCRVELR